MHESPQSVQTDRGSETNRTKRIALRARTLAVAYLLLLFAATHIPSTGIGPSSINDKSAHFGGYFLLAVLLLAGWELTIGKLQPRHYFAVWLAGVLYGAFDEWTQIPVWRTCDMNDWGADVLGVTVGIVAYQMLRPLLFAIIGRDGAAQ